MNEKPSMFLQRFILDGKGGARQISDDEVKNWTPDDGVLWAHFDIGDPDAGDWLINDSWRMTFAANLKFGRSRNVADDGRTSNSFPPFTCATMSQPAATNQVCAPGAEAASLGPRIGFEPLGRFRSGPIGMAQHEDELQLLLRYRF